MRAAGLVTCPTCGEATAVTGRYCEACGGELAAGSAGSAAPQPWAGGPAAAPDAIDGYCSHCGMKQPDPSDHREVDLGSIAAVTDRGLVHGRNEDAFAIARVERPDGIVRILVVCDGVSSTSDSHLAARGAVRAACDRLEQIIRAAPEMVDEALARTALGMAVADAQAAVRRVPPSGGENPSCTFVATIAADRPPPSTDPDSAPGSAPYSSSHDVLVVTGWLGDSRAYLLPDDDLVPLSIDDSWATDEIGAGMDPAAAYADNRAHSITRWLGADATDVEPRISVHLVPAAGRVLLCSDGLWNYAAEVAELRAVIDPRRPLGPLALAQSLTNFARDAGGHDNITVAVATLG
jgi:serine/threonine protein phosphatase PrpC